MHAQHNLSGILFLPEPTLPEGLEYVKYQQAGRSSTSSKWNMAVFCLETYLEEIESECLQNLKQPVVDLESLLEPPPCPTYLDIL